MRENEVENGEEEQRNEASLAHLASADERTKNMSREEYMNWSKCRQASFTFQKGKRFRAWSGVGVVTDSIPNDDVVDALGFLICEIVQTLTEEALRVKATEDLPKIGLAGNWSAERGIKKRKRYWEGDAGGLFGTPGEGSILIEPKPVREAFLRLQTAPKKYTLSVRGYARLKIPSSLLSSLSTSSECTFRVYSATMKIREQGLLREPTLPHVV